MQRTPSDPPHAHRSHPPPVRFAARLDRAWRCLATGLAFSLFGIGAALLGLTWLPLLRVTSASREAARPRIQRSISAGMWLFVRVMRALGLLRYRLEHIERLRAPGQLIIANHPTLIDVVFLIGLVPEVDCIVKQGLWRNPFLRWALAWTGYIPNDAAERMIAACSRSLRAGRSLIVFPEGTRSVPGRPLEMKRGAAQIALAADAPIMPVTIVCRPVTLTKGSPWYRVPARRPHWTLSAGEPFRASSVLPAGLPAPSAARQLTRHFREYFESRGVAPVARRPEPPSRGCPATERALNGEPKSKAEPFQTR